VTARSNRLALAAMLLRAEGARALLDRMRDRRLDARRRRASRCFRTARREPGRRRSGVLPFALQRRRGGAAIQLLVRLEARARQEPVALLQLLPDRLRCELWGQGVETPLAREWPAPPVEGLADVVAEAASWVGAGRLHFESLVDLAADLPLAASARGLAFGLSAHDFALYCPRPHLVEEPAGQFCDFSREPDRCARCLGATWPLPAGHQERRRERMAAAIAAADLLEFPSEYMRREHRRLFPGIDPARTRVLPPRSLAAPLASPPRLVRQPPARIAFAGAVHRHKGAIVFEQIVQMLAERRPRTFEWHVFGGGDPSLLLRLRRLPQTRVHGYYRAGDLPARLRAARIDLVLLPSIWPEAHCLVLDECAEAGVPVLAFDLGAPGERIRALGLGELIDPGAGAAGFAAHIASLG
jgi:glycosyltransferase involved in cell wall biosynthesis